jgi:hypothetical protein
VLKKRVLQIDIKLLLETDMKSSIIFAIIIFCIMTLFWSSSVSAGGGHRHYGNNHYGYDRYGYDRYRPYRNSGLYFGFPHVNYSYVHTSPRIIIKEAEEPIVYIEKKTESLKTSETEASKFWYYCKKPAGYYPTIERCADGWMQVVPHKPTN